MTEAMFPISYERMRRITEVSAVGPHEVAHLLVQSLTGVTIEQFAVLELALQHLTHLAGCQTVSVEDRVWYWNVRRELNLIRSAGVAELRRRRAEKSDCPDADLKLPYTCLNCGAAPFASHQKSHRPGRLE